MDTQRLILFVVFFGSALLLWEAWQKESRPLVPATASAPANTASAPAKTSGVPDLPVAPNAASTPVPGSIPLAATGAQPAIPGRVVTVTTDLYRAEVDPAGGVITQVALLNHRDPSDAAKPYLALL